MLTLVTLPLLVGCGAALIRDLAPTRYWLAALVITGLAFFFSALEEFEWHMRLDGVILLRVGAHTVLPCLVVFTVQRWPEPKLTGAARPMLAVGLYFGVVAVTVVCELVYRGTHWT